LATLGLLFKQGAFILVSDKKFLMMGLKADTDSQNKATIPEWLSVSHQNIYHRPSTLQNQPGKFANTEGIDM